jgi:hypothetical protein
MDARNNHNDDRSRAAPIAGGRWWLWWTLANAVAWGFGGPVTHARPGEINVSLGIAVGSVLAGTAQWVVLRRYLAGARLWIPASIVAGAGAAALGLSRDGAWVAAGGILLGVLQWLVLRREVARAGWWIPASVVGWALGGFLSAVFPGGFFGWFTIGLVYGAVTGATLLWLLRRPSVGARA